MPTQSHDNTSMHALSHDELEAVEGGVLDLLISAALTYATIKAVDYLETLVWDCQ